MLVSHYLWYIPNQNEPGHRGDSASVDHNSLAALSEQACAIERHGWKGALIGSSWGRLDTFTIATALAAVTTRFEPLMAIRPGYWNPAQFATAAATLDHLSSGRTRINIVSGRDQLTAYGDMESQSPRRYARTREFMALVRRLWTEESVTFAGAFYRVEDARLVPPITASPGRPHPPLYFGGASVEAESVAAAAADVQLFWGEPIDSLAERIDRLKRLSQQIDRDLPPLQFGLRITTLVRSTSAEAWAAAEAKVATMAKGWSEADWVHLNGGAVGQQRLNNLASQGDVLDECLYTAPARYGGGGAASTWLVGSPQEVALALRRYEALGISHFVLSDTPYLAEIARQGDTLLPLLRAGLTR